MVATQDIEKYCQRIAREFRPERIILFGSHAYGTADENSDVDLMVVSDALGYADLFSALEPASQRLGRKVNPTLYSRAEFAKRLQQRNAFATRVLGQSKLWVLGNEEAMNDITA